MGSLGAFFCCDYKHILTVVGHRLRSKRRDRCICLIAFVDGNVREYRDTVIPKIAVWHYFSKRGVEILIPGYEGLGEPTDPDYDPEEAAPHFNSRLFVETVSMLMEASEWKPSGGLDLVICDGRPNPNKTNPIGPAFLDLANAISFDLDVLVRDGTIAGVAQFFQTVINFGEANETAGTYELSDHLARVVAGKLPGEALQDAAQAVGLKNTAKRVFSARYFAVKNLAKKKRDES